MKFTINKKLLSNSMQKGFAVCTRGIRSEFKDAAKITIKADKGKVLFMSTNGYLDIITTINDVVVDEEGIATLNVGPATKIANAIGRDNDDIEVLLKLTGGVSPHVCFKNKNRSMNAKMETEASDLKFTISKPKDGFEHVFPCKTFCQSVNDLSKYKSPYKYRLRYLMMCLHFLPDYTRFICGCGMRFGVLEHKNKNTITDLEDAKLGDKKLLPAEQASIIASIIEGEDDILMKWKENKNCYIESGNSKLYLKGIPEEEYINYEIHAFRYEDAVAVVDIPREDLADLSNLVGATRDQESESEGEFLTCHLKFQSNGLLT